MPSVLVMSCSLSPSSRSRVLAADVAAALRGLSAEVVEIDLRDYPMPMCDGEACADPNVSKIAGIVRSADAILMAVPVYNWYVNAAAKNVIEQTGRDWEGKIVGFLCAAGGNSSYMSVMSLANSLMLDFRCLIVPRFVYATGEAFGSDNALASPKLLERIQQLARETMRLAHALGGR